MTTKTQTPKLVITTSSKGSRVHLADCKSIAKAKSPASPLHASPAVVAGSTPAACCKPEGAPAIIAEAGLAEKVGAESVALYRQTQDDSPAPAPVEETPAEPKPMTRKQCLEALAAVGYTGPTSYLMPRLREIVAEQGAMSVEQAEAYEQSLTK